MFSSDFLKSFNHAMLYEVGAFWDPDDPVVISGDISTRANMRKVGYVNIKEDRGGETKYGVAQNANSEIDVRRLDLEGAMRVYYAKYWLKGKCNTMVEPIAVIHFDGCVNHGVSKAIVFMQRALLMPPDQQTGNIGPITASKIENAEPASLITNIAQVRRKFYNAIVNNNPSQAKFLNGWLRRINEVEQYTLSLVA